MSGALGLSDLVLTFLIAGLSATWAFKFPTDATVRVAKTILRTTSDHTVVGDKLPPDLNTGKSFHQKCEPDNRSV